MCATGARAQPRMNTAPIWKYNIRANLVGTTEQLYIYEKATSEIQMNGSKGEWLRTTGLEIFFQTNLSCRASAPKNSLVLAKNILALLLSSENEKKT